MPFLRTVFTSLGAALIFTGLPAQAQMPTRYVGLPSGQPQPPGWLGRLARWLWAGMGGMGYFNPARSCLDTTAPPLNSYILLTVLH